MGTTFRPYQPDQMLLLPQDLREWVPEGHLAHHVSDLVDALDLSPFYAPYEGDGRRNSAYDPPDNASDQGRLIPMVDAVRDAFGETPEQVLADAGYCSEPNLQALKERDIDGYVSLAREGTAVMDLDPDKYPAKARMAKKLASEEGRRRYARRKWRAEAPVGWIKEVMGFRRFSFRGLEKVQAEWAADSAPSCPAA